jgi:hypothetical protein
MSETIEKVFQVQATNSREAIVADGVPRLGQKYVVREVQVNQYRPRLFNVCVSLAADQQKWISVRDQLPPIDRQVLFCCAIDGVFTEVDLGQFDGNWTRSKNAVAMDLDGDDWAPCSHWMELPEPPKK